MNAELKNLSIVLGYQNQRVLNKFRVLYDVSQAEAEELFIETKKWLWLCARRNQDAAEGRPCPSGLVIHIGMVVIDELWHIFILHTEAYADFCRDYLGRFIHHSPGRADFVPPTKAQTEDQLAYICDYLGEETLVTWYEGFADRYTPERLMQLLKPQVFGRPCEAL